MSLTIEKLKEQLRVCIANRDQYSFSYQQAIGAITLLQEQIKELAIEEALAKKKAEDEAKAKAELEAKLRAQLEAEAKKEAEFCNAATMDIKLDEGVLADGNTNG